MGLLLCIPGYLDIQVEVKFMYGARSAEMLTNLNEVTVSPSSSQPNDTRGEKSRSAQRNHGGENIVNTTVTLQCCRTICAPHPYPIGLGYDP